MISDAVYQIKLFCFFINECIILLKHFKILKTLEKHKKNHKKNVEKKTLESTKSELPL